MFYFSYTYFPLLRSHHLAASLYFQGIFFDSMATSCVFTPRPALPDWNADINDFVFFCSEWPTAVMPEFSNWHNAHYTLNAPYIGIDGLRFWCSEQELMVMKLRFCSNAELAKRQEHIILASEPEDVVPFGCVGWQDVWAANHHKASTIKRACRLQELELRVEDWNAAKADIMFDICMRKFSNSAYKDVLLSTGTRVLVEAAYYDDEFGIGFQTGEFCVKAKVGKPCVLMHDHNGQIVWQNPPGPAWGKNILGEALMKTRALLRQQLFVSANPVQADDAKDDRDG